MQGDNSADSGFVEYANVTLPTYTSSAPNGGIYCGRCGMKMYLSEDGSHRRCPNCDDK